MPGKHTNARASTQADAGEEMGFPARFRTELLGFKHGMALCLQSSSHRCKRRGDERQVRTRTPKKLRKRIRTGRPSHLGSIQCKRPQTRPKGCTNLVAKPQVSANTLPAAAKRRGSLRNCEKGGEGGVVTLMRRCGGGDSEHASCSRVRHDGVCAKSSEVDMTACFYPFYTCVPRISAFPTTVWG
jgi:hypothetical protein